MHTSSRSRTNSLLRIVLLLLAPAASPLWSQTDAATPTPQTAAAVQANNDTVKAPAFAVISVKRNLIAQGWRDGPTADGYSASAVTVNWLLPEAYGIREHFRIVGAPDWADTYRYDIQAKVDDSDIPALGKLDRRQRYAMIQQILEERFKIKVHRENRTQPTYSLVVVKPGLLIQAPPTADGQPASMGFRMGRGDRAGQTVFINFTMSYLAAQFSNMLGRMVVDNTALTGAYHGDLHFTNPAPGNSSAPEAQELSIFTAIEEQLGLKLVPTKGPVECLVIDHIEQPSEN